MKNKQKLVHHQTDLDIIRILLVILVVIGHAEFYEITTPFGGLHVQSAMNSSGIADTFSHRWISKLCEFIYCFHMPAFIGVSGILFAQQMKNQKWKSLKQLAINKAQRLWIPFLCVWLFWNLPVKYLSGYYKDVSIGKCLLQMLFPNRVYLWYLSALFFIFLITYLLYRYVKNPILILLLSGIFWILGIRLSMSGNLYIPLGNPFRYVIWFTIAPYIWNGIKSCEKYFLKILLFLSSFLLLIVIWHRFCYSQWYYYLKDSILAFLGLIMIYSFAILLGSYIDHKKENLSSLISMISGYSFGIYLYAEPLNYLILHIFEQTNGISCFGNEKISLLIIGLRIFITPLIAVFIVKLLKRIPLPFKLY